MNVGRWPNRTIYCYCFSSILFGWCSSYSCMEQDTTVSITANDHNNQYVCVWDAKNWLAFTTDRGTMLHHQSNTDSSHTIIMSQLIHFCCIWVVRGSLWSWVFVFVFFLSPGFCWINIGFNVDVDTANSTAAATSYNRLAPAYTRTLIYWMDGWNGTDVNANAECIGPIKLD